VFARPGPQHLRSSLEFGCAAPTRAGPCFQSEREQMTHAWLFPGQGSQKVGMGQELFAQSPRAKEAFERADQALGFSISKLCFAGPESDLVLTKYAQPALVATSIATLWAVQEALPQLPEPAYVAGHSLGEYSALVAAGSLTIEDAVRLVHIRGMAMQEAVPAGLGGMAAIMGGDAAAVQSLCDDAAQDECLAPANFNAPGQIVIAGAKAAIERAQALAKERGLKAIALNVSAPFHCALMQPAAERVAAALADIVVLDPRFPVVANVTAEPNSNAAAVRQLLVKQVASAVRWESSVAFMAAAGVNKAFELGPGKVLAGLVKRISKDVSVLSVGAPADLSAVPAFVG